MDKWFTKKKTGGFVERNGKEEMSYLKYYLKSKQKAKLIVKIGI